MTRQRKIHWGVLLAGLVPIAILVAVLGKAFSLDPGYIASPLIDNPAPDFELPRLSDGAMISRDALEGKPVAINFWATWCASCPQEHPLLVRAAREYEGRVTFVGVAYNDKNAAIEAWLKRHGGAAYPTLVDVNGKAAIAYGVYGVPETYVVDPSGTVRFKHTGPINLPLLRKQLDSLL